MTLEPYMIVRATFNPKRLDSLRSRALLHIGERRTWSVGWKIEEGEYAGQWALTQMSLDPFIGWVPECDLDDVELIAEA